MKLLLDTHVWLWWHMVPERIRKDVRDKMIDPDTELFLSTVSTWEMSVKIAAGRLQLPRPLEEMLPETMLEDDIRALPVQNHHCFELAALPMHHRDPFDRMLIAQARRENMVLVSADSVMRRYDVERLEVV